MFIPLKDDVELKTIPFQIVTCSIIVLCVVVFIYQVDLPYPHDQAFVFRYGTIPAVVLGQRELHPDLAGVPSLATVVTSMFLHGGWLHLLGNMLFLWVFGDNVEDATGHLRFLVFYLLCGVLATLAHVALHPGSTAPLVGASGAISGVVAAYLLLHPRARILALVFGKIPLRLPVWILLVAWIGMQVYNAFAATEGDNTAWFAHLGGLVAGAVLIPFFKRRNVPLFDRGRA